MTDLILDTVLVAWLTALTLWMFVFKRGPRGDTGCDGMPGPPGIMGPPGRDAEDLIDERPDEHSELREDLSK